MSALIEPVKDPARWTPEAWKGYPAMQEFLQARAEGRPYRSPNGPDKLDRAASRRERQARKTEETMPKKSEKKAKPEKRERQLKQPDRAVIVVDGDAGKAIRAESVKQGLSLSKLGLQMWEAYQAKK